MRSKQSVDNSTSKPSVRRHSYFQAVSFTGVGTLANIIFLFLETMIIARQLSTESYGVYALMIVFVNFLMMIIDFGTVTAVTQLIASNGKDQQYRLASNAILFRLITIALFSFLVLLGRNEISTFDPTGQLAIYAIYVPLMLLVSGLDEIFLAILQGKQLYRHMAVAQVLRSVFRLGLTIFFFYSFNLGFAAPVYSWIISYGISVTYEYLALPFSKRLQFDFRVLRTLLKFGFPLQLNNFLWFASTSSQTLLLTTFLGPAAVAYFDVAMRIPNAAIRVSQAYTAVYFPTSANLLGKGMRSQARGLLEHSLNLASFFMALVALISVLFNKQIVTLLFSEKYAASGPSFALFMIASHMVVLVTLMGYTLTSAGYPARSLGANLVRETLMLLANLLFIPLYGYIGTAYAKIIAFYLANPLSVWLLRRSDFPVSVAPYLKQTALLVGFCIFYWIFPIETVILKLAIITIFVILNFFLSTISRDDLGLILPESIKHRFGIALEAGLGHSADGS